MNEVHSPQNFVNLPTTSLRAGLPAWQSSLDFKYYLLLSRQQFSLMQPRASRAPAPRPTIRKVCCLTLRLSQHVCLMCKVSEETVCLLLQYAITFNNQTKKTRFSFEKNNDIVP